MIRFPRLVTVCLAAAVVLLLGNSATAQAVQKRAVKVHQIRGGMGRNLYVPGYPMLRNLFAQKELELVDEQKEKIKKIAESYREKTRHDWQKARDMPQQERRAYYKEVREKQKAAMEEAKAAVEKVLLPHQLDALKEMNLRMRCASYLSNPRIANQISLSDEQKEKISKARDENRQKIQEMQQEMYKKVLETLTTEQKKQLEEIIAKGPRAFRSMQAQPDQSKK